jgi:hypothetical protein
MSSLIKLLEHLKTRPGMYFTAGERSRSIHLIQAFLLGVDAGRLYVAEPRDFDCFREWVTAHYRVPADNRSGFDLILEHADGDEQLAYDEFFRLLPDYLRDWQELGFGGIQDRFGRIQEALESGVDKISNNANPQIKP